MALFCETYAPAHAGGRDAWGVFGATPAALLEILRPDVHLVVWHRALPRGIGPGCAKLAAAAPFRAAAEGTPEQVVDAIADALPCAVPLDLLLDLQDLAACFAAITGRDVVQLRLSGVAGDSCKHFHADAIGLRLLCTYRGAGTEWLPLAGPAAAREAAAAPRRANRLPTGSVALLKGEAMAAGAGCVHRSPPRGPRDPARLLLTLDEPGRIPL